MTATVSETKPATAGGIGRVARVIGPVVDVEFGSGVERRQIPPRRRNGHLTQRAEIRFQPLPDRADDFRHLRHIMNLSVQHGAGSMFLTHAAQNSHAGIGLFADKAYDAAGSNIESDQ